MISIIIPARNERFLQKTVDDILAKATGEIEILVVMDGPSDHPFKSEDSRVRVITHEHALGMRPAINSGAAAAQGKYLMKIDGHCMVSKGFDTELAAHCQQDWVVIPRRKRLDPENWTFSDTHKIDVDYEYLSFPGDPNDWGGPGLHGRQWNERSKQRLVVPIDENMSFQGSCWFMHKEFFTYLDLMDEKSYGIFVNEAQEIGLKAWLCGGKVMTNKNCWYAHLHKGTKYGRGYHISMKELNRGSFFVNTWLSNHSGWKKQTKPMGWLIEHFWPVPTWPDNWKELFPHIDALLSREQD